MMCARDINTSKIGKSVFKTGLVLSACALFMLTPGLSVTAFAQTSPVSQVKIDAEDKPISATPSVNSGVEVKETLPQDLRPEELSTPTLQTLPPRSIQTLNRNSWNAQTLTRSTGLSAASFNRAGMQNNLVRVKKTQMQAETRAIDILTAEDLLNLGDSDNIKIAAPKIGPTQDGAAINLGASVRGALFGLPTNDNINGSVFKLDLSERLCLGTAEECRANETRSIDIGYAPNISGGNIIGLDLQLTPRAGLRFDGESKSALVGALVRIGGNLHDGPEAKSNAWYVFAGADAEAVTYTPNSARRLTSGAFNLQNQVIVNDAQAGLGYRIGDADLALTYFKRQARGEDYKYNEDAAALSITWRR